MRPGLRNANERAREGGRETERRREGDRQRKRDREREDTANSRD